MRSCEILNENYMKNKDIIEWMLDEGIDPLTTVTTDNGEMYLSDILTKHLMEQLRIHDVVGQSEQLVLFADWLQYNGKWQLPEAQVKSFLKEQKQN
jgi:hypothetical protein